MSPTSGNLRPLVTADEYFDLIIIIMLGLGLVFEIPTVTFFLSRLGLVSPGMLLKVWRYALIVIFVVAAILSPTTDIPNLLVFARPDDDAVLPERRDCVGISPAAADREGIPGF